MRLRYWVYTISMPGLTVVPGGMLHALALLSAAKTPGGTPACASLLMQMPRLSEPVFRSRQAVKDNYFTENRKLVDLNKEVTDLETRLQQDFGTEGQFAALVDR